MQIIAPTTMSLKKEAFSSTQEAIIAFEKFKEDMCTTLILVMLDFTNIYCGV
jgi:hypothetical protein